MSSGSCWCLTGNYVWDDIAGEVSAMPMHVALCLGHRVRGGALRVMRGGLCVALRKIDLTYRLIYPIRICYAVMLNRTYWRGGEVPAS